MILEHPVIHVKKKKKIPTLRHTQVLNMKHKTLKLMEEM